MTQPAMAADTSSAVMLLERLKAHIGAELHAYPYPITGCDEVFKTLAAQKEWCRIALAGLAGEDGITSADADAAIAALLASPVDVTSRERGMLEMAACRTTSQNAPA